MKNNIKTTETTETTGSSTKQSYNDERKSE